MNVIFENPGLIDLRTIRTFGVSVKETRNPIGMFGTGLKYALAILLRTGHRVTLYRGDAVLEVTQQTDAIRGKEHEVLYLNDEPLPFTTHLGHNWKVWQAYRELYSNALDEGGVVRRGEAAPRSGVTQIVVSGSGINEVHDNRGEYMLQKTAPIHETDDCSIYEGASNCIFYRGMRALELEEPSRFTYDIKREMTLSEDRTLLYSWVVRTEIAECWQCAEVPQLAQVLLAKDGYEAALKFDRSFATSGTFMELCERHQTDRARLNASALDVFSGLARQRGSVNAKVLHDLDAQALDKALRTLKGAGVDITYPVTVVEDLGQGILGLAENDTIYISYECFLRGDRTLIGTLYEEFVHLARGLADCSRELQNHLLDRLVTEWIKNQYEVAQ